jgi:hypothetical protein
MRPQTFDPTAGERAREIRAHPGRPQRITDPTDPRYGKLLDHAGASDAQRIVDPTDRECGEMTA